MKKTGVHTTSSLMLEWNQPKGVRVKGSNGSPVNRYKIEWADRVNEVQIISIKAPVVQL